MSHFKDRIEAAQKAVDTHRTDVAELVGIAEAEERDLSESESLQLEELAKSIEAGDKRIHDLELAEKAMAQRVVEKEAPSIVRPGTLGHKERPKGDIFFKHATAAYMAYLGRNNVMDTAKSLYPNDPGLHAVVKADIDPADTTTTGWATELTQEANQGYLDLLRGQSVAAQLWGSAGVNLNFMGYTAINIPSRAGGDKDLASGFTGEGAAIPVRKATFGTQRIEPYKWAAIVTMTKEIMSRSTPAIEQLVRNGMITDTSTKLDADYLGQGAASAGFRPAGLFYNVTGTPASSGGATVGDDMLQDLRNLVQPFYAANMGQTLRIMIHPTNALAMSLVLYNGTYLFRDELARGTIMGIPVIQSTNIPVDELQCVDMAHQAVSSGAMTFEVNDSATIVEYDDAAPAPTMSQAQPRSPVSGSVSDAVTAADAAGGLGNVRSLFQTETVAIKSVQYLSWAQLRADATNRITGVSY